MSSRVSAEPSHPRRPWRSLLQRLGSLLPPGRGTPPAEARVVRPWSADARQNTPTAGLTPSKALSMLQAADAGQPAAQFELFNDMLQKWPRLAAVEATRRLALTGLDWEVYADHCPSEGTPASDRARRAADYARVRLTRLANLRPALDHLATAIGYGVAAAELIWEDGELIDVAPVPHTRLTTSHEEPWRLRILTEESPIDGVPLDAWPNKWIVHRPVCRIGRPFEGGLLRASALLYVAQNLSLKDWLVFSQVAGMPLRVARLEPGVAEEDRQAVLRMLESLGRDAVAVISKSVELEFVEAQRGGEKPYKALQDHCNREVTILWLGQHLTTDIAQSGSRAAAEIHDRVREDLLANDIAGEGLTLRRDVLRPMSAAKFGAGATPPHFRRSLVQAVDTRVLADTLAVAVRKLGMEVPVRWVHRALGIPQAEPGEATLPRGEAS